MASGCESPRDEEEFLVLCARRLAVALFCHIECVGETSVNHRKRLVYEVHPLAGSLIGRIESETDVSRRCIDIGGDFQSVQVIGGGVNIHYENFGRNFIFCGYIIFVFIFFYLRNLS